MVRGGGGSKVRWGGLRGSQDRWGRGGGREGWDCQEGNTEGAGGRPFMVRYYTWRGKKTSLSRSLAISKYSEVIIVESLRNKKRKNKKIKSRIKNTVGPKTVFLKHPKILSIADWLFKFSENYATKYQASKVTWGRISHCKKDILKTSRSASTRGRLPVLSCSPDKEGPGIVLNVLKMSSCHSWGVATVRFPTILASIWLNQVLKSITGLVSFIYHCEYIATYNAETIKHPILIYRIVRGRRFLRQGQRQGGTWPHLPTRGSYTWPRLTRQHASDHEPTLCLGSQFTQCFTSCSSVSYDCKVSFA